VIGGVPQIQHQYERRYWCCYSTVLSRHIFNDEEPLELLLQWIQRLLHRRQYTLIRIIHGVLFGCNDTRDISSTFKRLRMQHQLELLKLYF
jgi:hypothetical protein